MQRGEIFLANFPFGDQSASKLRPILLFTDQIGIGTEVIVAYITSVVPPTTLVSDVVLDPSLPQHGSTGLKTKSLLRLHKIGTIHVSSIQRRLGHISSTTQQEVDSKIKVLLTLQNTDATT
jgi:mRNA-degrading endonuclease toxin of MazEF toxin-antitoxin module